MYEFGWYNLEMDAWVNHEKDAWVNLYKGWEFQPKWSENHKARANVESCLFLPEDWICLNQAWALLGYAAGNFALLRSWNRRYTCYRFSIYLKGSLHHINPISKYLSNSNSLSCHHIPINTTKEIDGETVTGIPDVPGLYYGKPFGAFNIWLFHIHV